MLLRDEFEVFLLINFSVGSVVPCCCLAPACTNLQNAELFSKRFYHNLSLPYFIFFIYFTEECRLFILTGTMGGSDNLLFLENRTQNKIQYHSPVHHIHVWCFIGQCVMDSNKFFVVSSLKFFSLIEMCF